MDKSFIIQNLMIKNFQNIIYQNTYLGNNNKYSILIDNSIYN